MRAWFSLADMLMAELVLYVEPEQHDVAVLYDVIFPLKADQPFFFCRSSFAAV